MACCAIILVRVTTFESLGCRNLRNPPIRPARARSGCRLASHVDAATPWAGDTTARADATATCAAATPGVSRRALLSAGAALAAATSAPPRGAALPPLDYDVGGLYERVFDTEAKSWEPANPGTIADKAFARRVLIIGEDHNNPMHHRAQLRIVQAWKDRLPEGTPVVLGLEYFWRQQQPALDEFIFGGGSMSELKSATNWESTWGYSFDNYAKIFSWARANGVRLLGLNCPNLLVQLVSKEGFENIPNALKSQVSRVRALRRRVCATHTLTAPHKTTVPHARLGQPPAPRALRGDDEQHDAARHGVPAAAHAGVLRVPDAVGGVRVERGATAAAAATTPSPRVLHNSCDCHYYFLLARSLPFTTQLLL